MKKVFLVYNPVSGTGMVKKKMFDIVDFYNEHDCLVTLCPMFTFLEHDRFLTEAEISRYDYVVVSGGDGTLNKFLEYIRENGFNHAVGYIPTGSTNDYATSLGISRKFKHALDRSIHGIERMIDIGRFNGSSFLYVAAFGIFTRVVYSTKQEIKNIIGYVAYLMEGIKQLADVQNYRLSMKIDNEDFEGSFILGVISNSFSIGGMKNVVSKGIELDDGLFEVMFIRTPNNPMELAGIISSLGNGNPYDNSSIVIRKAEAIHIVYADAAEWTLDGEFGGKWREVDISIVNKGFRIRV